MAIPATQLRPGMIIKHNDNLHLVFKVEHRTPGNLRAFIQAKLRNLKSGAMFEHRFRSADAIEKVVVCESTKYRPRTERTRTWSRSGPGGRI